MRLVCDRFESNPGVPGLPSDQKQRIVTHLTIAGSPVTGISMEQPVAERTANDSSWPTADHQTSREHPWPVKVRTPPNRDPHAVSVRLNNRLCTPKQAVGRLYFIPERQEANMPKWLVCIHVFLGMLLLSVSSVFSAEIPLSGQCGFMCHVPMAYQGGAGAMAPRGLRPLEGDFSQMKARFSIRPEQEPAWKKFEVAATKPMADPHQAMGSQPPRTSLKRAKFMEHLWNQRYEHMRAVNDAFKDLYQVLDEDQKRVADQRFGYCELIQQGERIEAPGFGIDRGE